MSIRGITEEAIYRTAFEAWKFQVEQFWNRSSYYVVFQLAFATGIWKLFDSKHYWTTAFLCVGAIVLTTIWFLNNERTSEYISFYWTRLRSLEQTFSIPEEGQIFSLAYDWLSPRRSFKGDYKHYVRALPPVFVIGWLWMLGWCIRMLIHN